MKKILIIGRDTEIINQLVVQANMEIVTSDPDVVITHGGDGFLLEAERLYPGVPKLPLRYKSICKMCVDHDSSHLIKLLAADKLGPTEVAKLETTVNGKTHVALNEISVYHKVPNQAIRFTVQVNEEDKQMKAIGDGVIVATPFGSHAYYRSITSSVFRGGIGIAFNNTTESIDHMVLKETDTVNIALNRGPAYLLVDNDPDLIELADQAVVTIRQSSQPAYILGRDHLRCPDCGELELVVSEEK